MDNPAPSLTLSDLEFKLLNCFQRGLPLVACPFEALAHQLGTTEWCVIDHLQSLQKRGFISRVGAVFRPNTIGASVLAALTVPIDQLDVVASYISAIPEVNHNYHREHRLNLWFVVTASSAARLSDVLCDIEVKKKNASTEEELKVVRQRLAEKDDANRRWELWAAALPRYSQVTTKLSAPLF